MTGIAIKKGDFSALADDYTKYRPSYNKLIVDLIFGAIDVPVNEVVAADVGAGTGIFTKLILDKNPKTLYAVEPNNNMKSEGEKFLPSGVKWIGAGAEDTKLPSNTFNLVSMASSFHWPDTNAALKEFDRILNDKGVFVALWNPRVTELSETETLIDNILKDKFSIKSRVSSGRSGITCTLTEILKKSGYFSDVVYLEAVDKVYISPERYIGAWRSVNDIRSQLGEENFNKFIDQVTEITSKLDHVEVHYMTRAWVAKK